jgi:NAD(P)H-hydrate epimerase
MNEPQVIDHTFLKTIPLPDYSDEANKSDYGKLLIVAGSRRLPGPAILAARAALRSGCGTVRVAAPESIASALGTIVPELMVIPLPETSAGTIASGAWSLIEEQFEPCNAAVIGPGVDVNDETDELARKFVKQCPLPMLIDAQALIACGAKPELLKGGKSAPARILTPHLAEMSLISGQKEAAIEEAREATAETFAREHKLTLVLKGRETLIAAPDGKLHKNTAGTRGLGTAGSGDMLAGVIGGLLTQGMDATHAAIWGVYMHASCGEALQKDFGDDGILASDLVNALPKVHRFLRSVTDRSAAPKTGLRLRA